VPRAIHQSTEHNLSWKQRLFVQFTMPPTRNKLFVACLAFWRQNKHGTSNL